MGEIIQFPKRKTTSPRKLSGGGYNGTSIRSTFNNSYRFYVSDEMEKPKTVEVDVSDQFGFMTQSAFVNETPYKVTNSFWKLPKEERIHHLMHVDLVYFYNLVNKGMDKYLPHFAFDLYTLESISRDTDHCTGVLLHNWVHYICEGEIQLELFRHLIASVGRHYLIGTHPETEEFNKLLNQLLCLPTIINADEELARLENARKQTQAFIDEIAHYHKGQLVYSPGKIALAKPKRPSFTYIETMDPNTSRRFEEAAESFSEQYVWEENTWYQPEERKRREGPKHKSTFDIKATRSKNRKLNKLAKKARRK